MAPRTLSSLWPVLKGLAPQGEYGCRGGGGRTNSWLLYFGNASHIETI